MGTPSLAARQGARNGLLAALYILLIAWVMNHGQQLLINKPEWLDASFMLLLFVVSALVTGSLVLWLPVKLMVDGNKKEAGTALAAAGGTLIVVLGIVAVALLMQ